MARKSWQTWGKRLLTLAFLILIPVLLYLLARNLDEVLSKAFLYQQALHRAYAAHDRSLDMHVSHIRRKLQALGDSGLRLETVWGKGYLLSGQDV